MSAVEALRLAQASGVHLGVDGDDLILDADLEPPVEVVEAIRQNKAEIVALLTTPGSDWSAEDWRAYFDERVGTAEHDGGLSRADAEQRAYECCVVEMLWQNPPSASGPERCAHCSELLGEPGRDGLPYLTGDGGHTWVHSGCHGDWTAQRRSEAVAALAFLGLRPQAGES